jgi:predicted small lipoprotein YifL
MSQARKTTFITLAFLFGASLLSGCGISGPLYAPGTGPDAGKAKPKKAETSVVSNTESETPNAAIE